MSQPNIEDIEAAIATVPTAPDRARDAQTIRDQALRASIDKAARLTAVQQATLACQAGGYEIGQIVELARAFHAFLIETTPHA